MLQRQQATAHPFPGQRFRPGQCARRPGQQANSELRAIPGRGDKEGRSDEPDRRFLTGRPRRGRGRCCSSSLLGSNRWVAARGQSGAGGTTARGRRTSARSASAPRSLPLGSAVESRPGPRDRPFALLGRPTPSAARTCGTRTGGVRRLVAGVAQRLSARERGSEPAPRAVIVGQRSVRARLRRTAGSAPNRERVAAPPIAVALRACITVRSRPISTSTRGSARRLKNQPGCLGLRPWRRRRRASPPRRERVE